MAASIIDLLTSAKLRAAARKELEKDTKEHKYFALPRAPRSWIQTKRDYGSILAGDA